MNKPLELEIKTLDKVFGKPRRTHPCGAKIRPGDGKWICAYAKKYPDIRINFFDFGEIIAKRNKGEIDPMDINLKEWKSGKMSKKLYKGLEILRKKK